MDNRVTPCEKCGSLPHQCYDCEKCGGHVLLGMWPMCKGDSSDHGPIICTKNALFPFTVNHVDGKPMQINDMHHLRKVERDYGVVFSAFSHGSTNNVDPVSKDLPKFRGEDPDVRRDYRKRYER